MIMQNYHIEMSDRTMDNIYASSAARAIYVALHKHRGRKVVACAVGGDPATPEGGRIVFDVPSHQSLPRKPKS